MSLNDGFTTRVRLGVELKAYIEALLEDGLTVPVERGKEMVEVEIAAR